MTTITWRETRDPAAGLVGHLDGRLVARISALKRQECALHMEERSAVFPDSYAAKRAAEAVIRLRAPRPARVQHEAADAVGLELPAVDAWEGLDASEALAVAEMLDLAPPDLVAHLRERIGQLEDEVHDVEADRAYLEDQRDALEREISDQAENARRLEQLEIVARQLVRALELGDDLKDLLARAFGLASPTSVPAKLRELIGGVA